MGNGYAVFLYYNTLKFKVGCSFTQSTLQRNLVVLIVQSLYLLLVPLLSRILPSDACKIHKQGINIR